MKTEDDVLKLIESDAWMMDVLHVVSSLNLPDWWIGAGFVRNRVWDKLHGRARSALNDVDVIYLDRLNPDENLEKMYEKRLTQLKSDIPWSIKNHARMNELNGDDPYTSSSEGLSRWVETATCVGVRLNKDNSLELTAPHGIEDLVNLILRPSPRIKQQKLWSVFDDRVKKKGWLQKWPKLKIIYD